MVDIKARGAWDRLYSKHGMQFGGAGDLAPLLKLLKPQALVLDVGCGEGKSAEVLMKTVEVVGCDFSREALKRLRHRVDLRNGLNLVECDMVSLPFDDEKFDAISCVHALSHLVLDDRRAAAKEMYRVTKPSGLLFIEAFDRGDLRYGRGEVVESSTFVRGNGIMTHYFGKGEIAGLFPLAKNSVETQLSRKVTFGAKAGKRSVVRVLVRKQD